MVELTDGPIIIPSPKINVALDATVLSSLMSCARKTDFKYRLNLQSGKGKSNSLEVGSLIHKILEVHYGSIINGESRATAIEKGLIAGHLYITGCPYCADGTEDKPACNHQPGEYPGVKNTPEFSEGNKVGWSWALKSAQQYFDFYKNDSWVPLFVEEVKREILYEDDEIRVLWKAKIDLGVDTNQGIFPCDHKSFKQRRDKSSLNSQFIGQCLLMKTRNMIVNKFGLQTTLKVEERFTREVVSYSADRLIEWQSEILPYYAYKFIQYSENGYWPPNFTNCDTVYGPCEFKGVCESNRDMREEELRLHFTIGRKWDPMNIGEEE